jgi:adenine deaminase
MGIDYRKNISVAMKREKADLILKNGKIIDVINLKIIEKDVAIVDGMIVGIGKYDNSDNIIDLNGNTYLLGLLMVMYTLSHLCYHLRVSLEFHLETVLQQS